jgi:VWFA-related protein
VFAQNLRTFRCSGCGVNPLMEKTAYKFATIGGQSTAPRRGATLLDASPPRRFSVSHIARDGRTRGLVAAGLIAAAATFVIGQQPQQPPRFRAGPNFVPADIYPTKDGAPVEDLTAADFDVTEDGAPQKIETFEHIAVQPADAQATRRDPGSVTLANAQAADPHRRVFVIFLDNANVTIEGSMRIREPLIELLTRVLDADDLVGVMTPDMGPDQITFGRKTEVIEDGLRNGWPWGRKRSILLDEQEEKYNMCFPPVPGGEPGPTSALARELIARRRERIALDSLNDLVHHMSAIREGRTAVLAVSEGWFLYSPNQTLTNVRSDAQGHNLDPLPGSPQPVGVGPGGTLTMNDPNQPFASIRRECQRDQMELAMADDNKYFRDILGDANRANVSFYPIDPQGLRAFDSDIGPEAPPPISIDRAILRNRIESLRVLALNTDGIALVDNNDLRGQIRRLAADLTSYYLVGYYSTNAKLDGTYRKIKVRVKRPGVVVRARNGYRAATEAQVAAARSDAAPAAAPNAAITDALGMLERTARTGRGFVASGEPVVFHRGPTTGNQMVKADARVFSRSERVHLELQAAPDAPLWTGALLDRTGKKTPVPVAVSERTDPASSQRWFIADVTLAPLGPGDYVIELTRSGDAQKLLTGIRVTQ